MRPLVVMSGPDEKVVEGAWADFEPAVPVTTSGLAWAAIGFVVAGGIASVLRRLARTGPQTRPPPRCLSNPLAARRVNKIRAYCLILIRPSTFG